MHRERCEHRGAPPWGRAAAVRGHAVVGAAALAFVTGPASADPVRGIQSAQERPVAVPGSIMMLPLRAEQPGSEWPSRLRLRLASGREVEGVVAWVHPDDPPGQRGWSADPRGLAVRLVDERDDSSAGRGAPFLLARMPEDAGGAMRLGGQVIRPAWIAAAPDPAWPAAPPLELRAGLDRPDPRSPFERWRWALLAEQMQQPPPPLHGDGAPAAMVAEHYTGLWRAALARLTAADPELASRCQAALTRVCLDRGRPVAAWVIAPERLAALLAALLDPERSADGIADGARAWLESVEPVMLWVEAEHPEHLELVLINRGDEPFVARFSWERAGEIPIAAELRPGVLTALTLQRPPMPEAPAGLDVAPAAPPEVLRIEIAGRTWAVAPSPRWSVATPPAAFAQVLRPPLTLAEIEGGVLLRPDPERMTAVQLRRVSGRWELFFECRRPAAAAGDGDGASAVPTAALTPQWAEPLVGLPLGKEAITVLLGPIAGERSIQLEVPEQGPPILVRGSESAAMEVHRRSWTDRWLCRIVLPRAWLPADPAEPLLAGCARTFGDQGGFQAAPSAGPPWRAPVARTAVVLDRWGDLP